MSPDMSGFSMLELFRTEVETQAAQLSKGLLAIEQTGCTAEQAEPLMRAAHSIKGAARIVGVDVAVRVAHAMEDVFTAAQNNTITLSPEAVDVLLQGVDLLNEIAQLDESAMTTWPDEQADRIETLTAAYAAIQAGQNPPAATEPPPPTEPAAEPSQRPASPPETSSGSDDSPPPAPPPPGPTQAKADEQADRVLRVSAENMSRLLGLAGETVVHSHGLTRFGEELMHQHRSQLRLAGQLEELRAGLDSGQRHLAQRCLTDVKNQLAEMIEQNTDNLARYDRLHRRMNRLGEQLYREVIRSRMRPLSDGLARMGRMVRDLGRSLGKKVRLEILGEQTDVDRDILDKLEAPLTHLLRNAVDHGLEPPSVRGPAGKDETGTIRLAAGHKAGMLHVTIADDGAGIDLDALKRTIAERNLAAADLIETMSQQELLEFLFLPSFTTRRDVSEVSGRGVGLDVVRTMLQEVAGSITVETNPGRGTTFHLQLPLTLSVLRGLLLQIAGESYALPLFRVERCLRVSRNEIHQAEGRQYVEMDGQAVGLIAAAQVLKFDPPAENPTHLSVVVLSDATGRYGLEVDAFLGERDLVVRPLDRRLGKVRDVSAAAVLDDGTVSLLLDADDLLRSAEALLTTGRLRRIAPAGGQEGPARRVKRILVVDDSITVREVQRRLLESHGYEVETAVDGADGFNAIRGGNFDLLITDIDMPRMNGIELTRQVRGDRTLGDLPIMVVSYKDRQEDRLAGLDAGANYYLTKSSFQDETLLDAVSDLIGPPDEQ